MGHNVMVMSQHEDEVALTLSTEQRLFPAARVLTDIEAVGIGKTLLVRPATAQLQSQARVSLRPAATEQEWHDYTRARVEAEAGFGIDREQTEVMVCDLRERAKSLGLRLYLARDGEHLVGAIARFLLPAPHQNWARLQEIDVFPSWRGNGFGDAVLASMFAILSAEGSAMVFVGADEDDWPLSWYRRRGFRDVARVALTR